MSLFAMHGAIYLYLKTDGAVQAKPGPWMWHTWGVFLVLYPLVTIYTLNRLPGATSFQRHPWAMAGVVLNVLAVANVPRALFHGRWGQTFVSTTLTGDPVTVSRRQPTASRVKLAAPAASTYSSMP